MMKGDFIGWFLVNCVGLYCDCVVGLVGEWCEICIVLFCGEYYKLIEVGGGLVCYLIYFVFDL